MSNKVAIKVVGSAVCGFVGGFVLSNRKNTEEQAFINLNKRVNEFVWREHYKIHDVIKCHNVYNKDNKDNKDNDINDLNTYMRVETKDGLWDVVEFDKLTKDIQKFKYTSFDPLSANPILHRFRSPKQKQDFDKNYKFPYHYYDMHYQYHALRALESTAKLTNYVNKEIIGKDKVYKNVSENIHEDEKCNYRTPLK